MWGMLRHKALWLLRGSLSHGAAIYFQSSQHRRLDAGSRRLTGEKAIPEELHTCLKPLQAHVGDCSDLSRKNKTVTSARRSHWVRRHVQVISPYPKAWGEQAGAVKWVEVSSPLWGRKDMLLELELNKVHKPKQLVSHFLISNSTYHSDELEVHL